MGFSFSDPYIYDGLLAGGVPEMVQCADDLDYLSGVCRDLKVCVSEGGSSFSVISTLMPDRNIRAFPSRENVPKFLEGECNVIAGLALDLGLSKIRSKGYEGPYQVGKRHFAKEPLCMATRDDDQQWSDFVNWVLRALIAAEAKNVTMDTANEFMTTSLFGDQYKDMFTNDIRPVGNYGEFYQRNFEKLLPRMGGLNDLNNGTTGLIYAHPFGPILSAKGSQPLLGSTLEMISSRGYVRCGVITGTPRMGLDGDYCTALAASIFGSDKADDRRHVVLRNFSNRQDGMNSLASKEIDALSGGVLNLQNDV